MRKLIFLVKNLVCISLLLIGTYALAQEPISINNESDINSAFQEYSPAFFSNGLVFVASNPSVNTAKKADSETGKSTTSIFFVRKGEKGNLQNPVAFAEELTTKYYDGPLSFSTDGNTIYFTRSHLKKGKPVKSKDGSVKLKIYSALRVNNKWVNITEMPFNSVDFDCAHPSVSQDGRRLYFASNRSDGFGGWDIYVSTLINGKWSDPINLGPKVNTAKNEVFPFIHPDGKVYFSSNGRQQGVGNLDIFYTLKTDTGWLKPHLLPEPVNSRSDDFGIIISNDKKSGYFSSNRASGKGDDDIFSFTSPQEIDLMIQLHTSEFSEPKVAVVATQPDIKKEDSALPATESPKVIQEAPKTEIVAAVQPEVKKEAKSEITYAREPVFDETVASEAPIKLETPSDKPLKKLSEPKVELSKTEFAEAKVSATTAQQMSPSDKPQMNKEKFVDSSVQSFISPANPVMTRRANKSEKQDEHNAALIVKAETVASNKPLPTSSPIKSKYLVVVGTYSLQENAVIQKKIAVKKGFTSTEIIQYEDNNLYGVCVRHFNDEKDAQLLARTIHKDLKMDAFVKVLK